ncbi:hypothetical protein B0H34DRAFT_802194 [Crassisporium funariophilum]|nr:hypothetical protein B0H34DRAFT_802194 [Crassisporium funariophilum]
MSSANLEGEATTVGPIFITAASPFDDPKADLILRSSDGVHYYTYKVLLSLVSPIFDDMFTISGGSPQDIYDNRPLVVVDDNSRSLLLLLLWCDPRCMSSSTSLQDLQILLEMADKYSMDSIIRQIRDILFSSTSITQSEPLKVYAIAIRFRMEELAKKAATETLPLENLHGYEIIPELKHITGTALANLLKYHFACRRSKTHLATDLSWIDRTLNTVRFFVAPCLTMGCSMTTRNNNPWKSWWIFYMDTLGRTLQSEGTGEIAYEPTLLLKVQAKIKSAECKNCRKHGYEALTTFTKTMAKIIDSEAGVPEDPPEFKVEY